MDIYNIYILGIFKVLNLTVVGLPFIFCVFNGCFDE